LSQLTKIYQQKRSIYALSISIYILFVITAFTYNYLRSIFIARAGNYVLNDFGDSLWNLAAINTFINVGVFERDSNLAWPNGFSSWVHPQFGVLNGILSQILGFMGFDATQIILLLVVVGSLLNVIAIYVLVNSISSYSLFTKFNLSACLGFSIFTFDLIGHFHIRQFYLIPFSIYIFHKMMIKKQIDRKLLLLMSILCMLSPTWWSLIVFYLFSFMLALYIIRGYKKFEVKITIYILIFNLIGQIIPILLAFKYNENIYNKVRGAWDSNIYSGTFSDLLISSPIINKVINNQDLISGTSLEPNRIGTIGSLLILISLFFIIRYYSQIIKLNNGHLVMLFAITILFFLRGGLSNLTSGIFVIFEQVNPARVWSRSLIIIAILSLIIVVQIAEKIFIKNRYYNKIILTMSVFLLLTTYVDYRLTDYVLIKNKDSLLEIEAVEFIQKNNFQKCPILQLPMDSFPVNKVSSGYGTDVELFHYRGFIPFILDPKQKWSFGLDDLKIDASFEDLNSNNNGYCYILFDKLLAETATSRGVVLNGIDVNQVLMPVFKNSRFEVIQLNGQ
jgi:hypothetical protein